MIFELLLTFVVNSTYDLAKGGLKQILSKNFVDKAIEDTADTFRDLPYVKDSLNRWMKSEEFSTTLEDIQAGLKKVDANDEIRSFIREGGFSGSVIRSEDQAAHVLATFRKQLERAILQSEDAHLLQEAKSELRHSETLSAIEQVGKFSGGRIQVLTKEVSTKVSYDNERTWLNLHRLQFRIRENNRPMEIDLAKSIAGEAFNLLEVQIIFEGYYRYGFDFDRNLKKLLKTKSLSPNFGENWLKLDSGRPVDKFKNAFHIEWFLTGSILLREFPELVFLPWLDRDFLTYPTRSEAQGRGEPKDAPKIVFFLNETQLQVQDEMLAKVPGYKPREKQLSDYLLD